jgi:hypothetical protein
LKPPITGSAQLIPRIKKISTGIEAPHSGISAANPLQDKHSLLLLKPPITGSAQLIPRIKKVSTGIEAHHKGISAANPLHTKGFYRY